MQNGTSDAQVTDINGKPLVHKELGPHTNNYAELSALGLGINELIRREHEPFILYTDSNTILSWVAKGNPSFKTKERDVILKMITKIQGLLKEHPEIEVRKWNTNKYGEIPADFGRK